MTEYQLKYYRNGDLNVANVDFTNVTLKVVKEGLNRKRVKGEAKITFNSFPGDSFYDDDFTFFYYFLYNF